MRLLRTGPVLLLSFSLLVFSAVPVSAEPAAGKSFAVDRIIVKFKDGTAEDAKVAAHDNYSGTVLSENAELGVQIVQIPAGKVWEKVNTYCSDKTVQFAEPDFIAQAIGDIADPYFNQEWGMLDIQAPQAWNITAGNQNIKIAILDTGIDQDHEDLTGKIVTNVNFSVSTTVDDLYGHGTHIAGIVAASSNGLGVVGVAYNSSIINVKVLDDNGSGYYSSIADGITWSADNGARVINMSLGGISASKALQSAVDYAWRKGAIIVAAAGNNSNTTPFYPAYYKNCIAVAATGQDGTRAYFSSYGRWVDLAAPGLGIFSTLPNHNY